MRIDDLDLGILAFEVGYKENQREAYIIVVIFQVTPERDLPAE